MVFQSRIGFPVIKVKKNPTALLIKVGIIGIKLEKIMIKKSKGMPICCNLTNVSSLVKRPRIFEPSSGGLGKRLKIIKTKLKKISKKNNCSRKPDRFENR